MKRLLVVCLFIILGCSLNKSDINYFDSTENKNFMNNSYSEISKLSKNFIYVIGKGVAPNDENLSEQQRYLLAERAAIVDGYRKLSEKLQGFIISTLTKTGNFTVNMDVVKVQSESIIEGAEIVEINHEANGICTAKLRIPIPSRDKIIKNYNQFLK